MIASRSSGSSIDSRPRRAGHPRRRVRHLIGLGALAISVGPAAVIRAGAAEPAFYDIEKSAKDATAGTSSTASVAVVGKNGWHVNAEAPITLTLVADPGVTLAKGKLTRADLAETSLERARFDVAFTPSAPGKKKITADARFVMCQEQACKPVKESVVLEVAVADASPPAGKGGQPKVSTAPSSTSRAKSKTKGHPAGVGDDVAGSAKTKSEPSGESW